MVGVEVTVLASASFFVACLAYDGGCIAISSAVMDLSGNLNGAVLISNLILVSLIRKWAPMETTWLITMTCFHSSPHKEGGVFDLSAVVFQWQTR